MRLKKLIYLSLSLFILLCLFKSPINFFNKNINSNNLLIHYIDVGQGDCILIQLNNKNLLIDSGPKDGKKSLISYLDNLNIKVIDYLIATHPHEDHIGNMSTIIKRYDVKKFYAPKVSHTSTTFENMVSALIDKNLKISILKEGTDSITLGLNAKFSVFSPPENLISDNLNDYSPIIKLEYLNTSFLFTGDAESISENYVLLSKYNLKADVLKVGHHGSSTSTSSNFYNSVAPSIAIISVGLNNTYNHPTSETLSILESNNPLIYRTDINGTIILNSDGNKIEITTKNKYSYK